MCNTHATSAGPGEAANTVGSGVCIRKRPDSTCVSFGGGPPCRLHQPREVCIQRMWSSCKVLHENESSSSVAAGARHPHHAPIRQGHRPPITGLHPAPPARRWPYPGAPIVRGELPAAREGGSPPLRVRGRQGRPAHGGRRQHHFHSPGSAEGQAGFFQERAPPELPPWPRLRQPTHHL